MAVDNNKLRWVLLKVSIEDDNFTVLDNLTKKRRIYHVPNLVHAEILQEEVYIFTSNSKIMQLNLSTATRQFLSATQLEHLKKIQQTHKSLHTKQALAKKTKRNLMNIKNLPSYAFSNTIISY